MVDLHAHSTYSDGVYSPSIVVTKAYTAGCELFALTDHDTTDGIDEARQTATTLGLTLVAGCEISALYNNMTIHIIALGIDTDNTTLQNGLKHHQHLRYLRAQNIATFLENKGISGAMEQVKTYAKQNMITRTHFARMLIEQKICSSMKEVFTQYLGNNMRSTHINWASITQVISWIHAAGGLAVLAHPLRYHLSKAALKVLIRSFSEAGGDGIETITARSEDNQINQVMGLGHKHQLLFSQGSDFHGDNTYTKIGRLKQIEHPHNIAYFLPNI